MSYAFDRNHEQAPSVEFSEASARWANLDPCAKYVQDVIKYEFGPEIASNDTAPAVVSIEQPATEAIQYPTEDVQADLNEADMVTMARLMVEEARQEGAEYGN